MALSAVGFEIAWWRARARVRMLEAELREERPGLGDHGARHLEDRLALMDYRLQQLAESQALLADRLLTRSRDTGTDASDFVSRSPDPPRR